MRRITRRGALAALLLTFLVPGTTLSALPLPRVRHVFIISLDGGKPSVMKQSKMPTLMQMLREGAGTWQASTVLPSVTLVSHTSMLTGLQPAKHKVNWNDWKPKKGVIKVPTIFSLAKARGFTTAMFVCKPKFRHLNLPGSLDKFEIPGYTAAAVVKAATPYIIQKKPALCFLHFADSDSAGHKYGWGSSQQKRSFADEDRAIKAVRDAVIKAGIAHESVIIISSDHGGHGRRHGSSSPEDVLIPWIAWGRTARAGLTITQKVSTCDTAATALWLLGIPLPANMDGKPVATAF